MTLTEKINSNPYLKVSNCTDIADLEYAIDELRKLDAEFGEDNKTLLKLWLKFLDKKKKLEAKASASIERLTKEQDTSATGLAEYMNAKEVITKTSKVHPFFEQALKTFMP